MMLNLIKWKVGIVAGVLILVGGGCTSSIDSGAPAHCEAITEHGSCIKDGIDEALIGSWTLESQSLISSAGTINSPFVGRTTTFKDDGSFTEDYGTESTSDVNAAGVNSHCEVSGVLNSAFSVIGETDLDDPSLPTITELDVVFGGGSPSVECGAGSVPAKSNAASMPLGAGPATGTSHTVKYSYTINSDWSSLEIRQENPYNHLTTVYTFSR